MADSYPDLIRQLAGALQGLEEERAAAHRWHHEQLAGADAAIAAADQAVATAAAGVTAAQALVDRVDNEAALLWRALGARLGRGAARRLGTLPAPATPIRQGTAGRDAGALLRRVRARLDQVPARRARPLWVSAVLLLLAVAVLALAVFLTVARFA